MPLSDILPDFLLPYLPEYTPEALNQLLSAASLSLFTIFVLAVLSAPLLACATRLAGLAGKKAFLDKCAGQLFELSVLLSLFLTAVFAGGGYMLHQSDQAAFPLPDVFVPIALPLGLALYAGLALVSPKSLKKMRGPRLGLAGLFLPLLAALFFGSFLLFVVIIPQPSLSAQFADNPVTALLNACGDFLASPLLWLLLCYFLCTGLALSSALALLWFIARRNKADYGRDYYAYVMWYASSVALASLLIFAAAAGGALWLLHVSELHDLTQTLDPGILIVGFGLPVCCAILWAVIIRSATPMRHKAGAFFSVFFLLIALCAQFINFVNVLPEP